MRRPFLLLRLLVRGCWDTGVILAYVAIGFSAVLGVLTISDALHPPRLPAVVPLGWNCYGGGLDTTPRPSRAELLAMDREERYATMQGALAILDAVSPEIADWTRGRWASGQLVFETADLPRYAYYMPAIGLLGINLAALEESDADLACTLAHEFRHSRQNSLCGVQKSIAALFGISRKDLVEPEAYEFEDVVRRAIRGQR